MGVQKSKKSVRFTKFSMKKVGYKPIGPECIMMHVRKDARDKKNIFRIKNRTAPLSVFFCGLEAQNT